ncbi:MAG: sensor histidine kinase, partial [Saprospiraceae bacterium]
IKSLRLEKEHEQQQRLSLAFILALISLLFIGSLYFIHRSRKANQELEAKNKLIEKQKEELETSNKNLANKNKLIEKQKEELEISNKDLEQFAYIASHDLKEPVRTIGSYASLLNRRYSDKLGDSGSEFVSFIKQASIRMNLLLTDLLHYSRLNKHKFEKTDVNMNNILIIVEENLYGVFKDNKVKLEVTDLPLVQANKIQMVRMFQNLIKNGVVYNKSEGKTIKIWAEEEKEKWTFFVKDNGIGIAPEYQEKVFEIFKRLHSKDEYDGSGIGLSSCQKIVMMHGGKINLKSELGEGTTFYFTIPKE